MKSSLLLAVLFLSSVAQADVAAVRRKVTAINAMKLSPTTTHRTDLSSEGAQITVWRDRKGAPRKIVSHVYGEMGRGHDTLYLENGLPLFLFSVDEDYDGPLSLSVKVAKREEKRFYFEKGKLLQQRDGKKIRTLTPALKQDGEKSVREMLETYLSRDGRKDEPRARAR